MCRMRPASLGRVAASTQTAANALRQAGYGRQAACRVATRASRYLPIPSCPNAPSKQTDKRTAALVGLGEREVAQDAPQPVLEHRMVLQRALHAEKKGEWQHK